MIMYLSFETAKHLHELGVTFDESPIGYLIIQGKNQGLYVPPENGVLPDNSGLIKTACFEELWAKLPFSIGEPDQHLHKELIETKKGEQRVQYYSEKYNYALYTQQGPSPTEAAGKLLGRLKEKGLI